VLFQKNFYRSNRVEIRCKLPKESLGNTINTETVKDQGNVAQLPLHLIYGLHSI
jgi:hypothetical protein